MSILNRLSSKLGDKSETSNKIVADQCINEPELLKEIAKGFTDKDRKLQSDCIEVFTIISEHYPELTVPFAEDILPLLSSKETKSRWEAVHTLSYIAHKVPELIISVSQELKELIENDKSTIVRDYAIDTIANVAKVNKKTAEMSYEILKYALLLWKDKHAKQVLKGFGNVIDKIPLYKFEMKALIEPFLNSDKKVLVTESKKVMKKLENIII